MNINFFHVKFKVVPYSIYGGLLCLQSQVVAKVHLRLIAPLQCLFQSGTLLKFFIRPEMNIKV